MKKLSVICSIAVLLICSSCLESDKSDLAQEQRINSELQKITGLLQDSSFSLEMAKSLEQAYYASQGQAAPDFLPANADSLSIRRRLKEEKIATNIAAFYALECGIGVLMEQKRGTPVEWLDKIMKDDLDSTEALVLNRFANATWKAGQPFRGLNRITRDNFISASLLSAGEIEKDYDQIKSASVKLSAALQDVKDSIRERQTKEIGRLLKDERFALEMAEHMEAAYYQSQQQQVPVFLRPGEDSAVILKTPKEEKIATNIAGLYALECGLSFLATAQNKLPSEVLQSIINDEISNNDKRLFERFANATWKAGQPFRGLDRIARGNFVPFDLLTPEEIDKDWVQIKAAANKLGQVLN